MERRALLCDEFVAAGINTPMARMFGRKATEHYVGKVRQARRFVFDHDATLRVAEVIATVPDLLAREALFARAPYDLCWIEFQALPMWERLSVGKQSDEDADRVVGYLIDHNKINVVADGKGAGMPPVLSVLQYHLNTEWELRDQIAFSSAMEISQFELCAFMWGSTIDRISPDDHRLLRNHNVVELAPMLPPFREKLMASRQYRAQTMQGSIGEMRTIIALLLMLNRPSITRYSNVPASRGWRRGKTIGFMQHTTVEVGIDPVQTLRLIGTPAGDSVERRRHEVRGHYCHDQTARDYMRIAGCIHDWQACDEEWTPWPQPPAAEVMHWCCRQCGGKRWWRAAHERGTAERGFVAHDLYEVKP